MKIGHHLSELWKKEKGVVFLWNTVYMLHGARLPKKLKTVYFYIVVTDVWMCLW